jgi:hypothetical protein
MNPSSQNRNWQRAELMHLLSLSGALAGFCITGVTLFNTVGKVSMPQTIADDVLAVSALIFLLSTYTIFIALRIKNDKLSVLLEYATEILFLIALTGMVAAGFVMVYTIW